YADRRQFVVWDDRAGKQNTMSVGLYGRYDHEPTLLRLKVNIYSVYSRRQCWEPEGPQSEITFMPGEEHALAAPLAKILAGPDPHRLVRKAWTAQAVFENPAWAEGTDRLQTMFDLHNVSHNPPPEAVAIGIPYTSIRLARCLDPYDDSTIERGIVPHFPTKE